MQMRKHQTLKSKNQNLRPKTPSPWVPDRAAREMLGRGGTVLATWTSPAVFHSRFIRPLRREGHSWPFAAAGRLGPTFTSGYRAEHPRTVVSRSCRRLSGGGSGETRRAGPAVNRGPKPPAAANGRKRPYPGRSIAASYLDNVSSSFAASGAGVDFGIPAPPRLSPQVRVLARHWAVSRPAGLPLRLGVASIALARGI